VLGTRVADSADLVRLLQALVGLLAGDHLPQPSRHAPWGGGGVPCRHIRSSGASGVRVRLLLPALPPLQRRWGSGPTDTGRLVGFRRLGLAAPPGEAPIRMSACSWAHRFSTDSGAVTAPSSLGTCAGVLPPGSARAARLGAETLASLRRGLAMTCVAGACVACGCGKSLLTQVVVCESTSLAPALKEIVCRGVK